MTGKSNVRLTGDPRGNYEYIRPPIGVPVEDAPCAKCAELTERYRMQSETLGRYVDENLMLQNRLGQLDLINVMAFRVLHGKHDVVI